MEFIKYLYSHVDSTPELSALMTGIATVVLAIITWRYVRLTKHILEEHRLMRLDANKPEIVVSLLPHETHINWVMLCAENIGTGLARHVKFTADPSSIPSFDTPLEQIGFLKREIGVFAPGRKIQSFLVSAVGKFDELKQQPFKITVAYKDSENIDHTEDFPLDFGELEGLSREGSPLFEVVKAIRDVKGGLRDFTTKPIVLTESLAEYERRQRTVHLEDRIISFSGKARTEIIEEIETLITKKEQEVRTERQSQKTAMDIATNRNKGQHELEEKWGTRPDATDESTNHDENI